MQTLKGLFLDELEDIYNEERQMIQALPQITQAATCPIFRAVLRSHLQETRRHLANIERIFISLGERTQGRIGEATLGLVCNAVAIASRFKGSAAINAALIGSLQKMRHYEIASYGCLAEWASLLGYDEEAWILREILGRKKFEDKRLTEIARASSNEEAGLEEQAQDFNGFHIECFYPINGR